MFINSTFENERYDFLSLFGREMFFHEGTNNRIEGWETPISVIFKHKNDIIIRFKKELKKYMHGFVDEPFDDSNSGIWTDVFRENHIRELPNRKIDYAISMFKKEHNAIYRKILTSDELESLLCGEQLLPDEFSFVDDTISIFDSDCFWFPVGVDTIIADFVNRPTIARTTCAISRFNGERYLGHIGYDKKFYHLSNFNLGDSHDEPVYGYTCSSLDDLDHPSYPKHLKVSTPFYEANFYKDYIQTENDVCYNYDGDYIEGKTIHHKNVSFLNKIIKRFWNHRLPDFDNSLKLTVTYSGEIDTVTFDTIDYIIIPYMKSFGGVSDSALLCYEELKKIFLKAGITSNFTEEFKTILRLNKSHLFGGSKRGFCGKRLVENLKFLQKRMDKKDFLSMLSNEETLKAAILEINNH